MPSKNQICFVLKEDDLNMLKKAIKKYKLGQSELVRKIISNWLFENKLNLEK